MNLSNYEWAILVTIAGVVGFCIGAFALPEILP